MTAERFIALCKTLRSEGVAQFTFQGCSATLIREQLAAEPPPRERPMTDAEVQQAYEETMYHSS